MQIRSGVELALRQIREQKLKSGFAVLGVIIGVMFLVAVVSVVEGMDRYISEDFANRVYGLNTITVRRTPSVQMNPSPEQRRAWDRRPELRIGDAQAIRDQLTVPAVVAVSTERFGAELEGDDGTRLQNVYLAAVSADYFRVREHELAAGRLFGAAEERAGAPVVILGHDTADRIFGARDPLGRSVRIEGQTFRVIGVLQQEGTLLGFSLDNRAVAPITSVLGRTLRPPGEVSDILVRTEEARTMERARMDIEAAMRVRHRLRPDQPNTFELETADESLAFWTQISNILYIAFPGLVSIALIVGGMVIMNIMLVSVVERTREIGMRKAVGAKRRDILLQVLVESGTLSGLGALVGISIGIILSQLVRAFSPLPASIAPHWLAVAGLLGVCVGVAAGVYPATRAARLDPVVALRQE